MARNTFYKFQKVRDLMTDKPNVVNLGMLFDSDIADHGLTNNQIDDAIFVIKNQAAETAKFLKSRKRR